MNIVVSGLYVTDATITATVLDFEGHEMLRQDWPVVLEYMAGSNANYIGPVLSRVPFVASHWYLARIDAVAGDLVATWAFAFSARTRTGEAVC